MPNKIVQTGWLVSIAFTKVYRTDKVGEKEPVSKQYIAWGYLFKEDAEAYYLAQVLGPDVTPEVTTKVLKTPNTKVIQVAKVPYPAPVKS